MAAAEGAEEVDAAYVASLKAAMPTESQIAELTKERKDLASAGPRDKHFNQGALMLFIGTSFAIEVCCCIFEILVLFVMIGSGKISHACFLF